MRQLAASAILIAFILTGCASAKPTVEISGRRVSVYVADEPSEITAGLTVLNDLDYDKGMLFVYPDYDTRVFWMKGMRFTIDIIWIRDNRVVGIEQNVPIPTTTDNKLILRYDSPNNINYVLEVSAGWSRGILIGDEVIIHLISLRLAAGYLER